MRLFAVAVLVATPVLAQPAPPPQPGQPPVAVRPPVPVAEGPAGWAEKFDELWKRRDQPGVEKELHQIVSQQLTADPRSFEANWRLASLLNWQANGTEGDRKADLGKQAWAAGDKAIAANPKDVKGHYQAAVGVGLYSEGIGILSALSQGVEGKFKERIQAALKIDKDYLDGAPQVVWGRYFFKLPWPKRDTDESIRVLAAVVDTHPTNYRAKIYLADSLMDAGNGDEGRKLVQQVIDGKVGEDAPEDNRLKDMAKKWMASH